MVQQIKRIAKFALFGTIGFGIGGAIRLIGFGVVELLIMGAIGGAALGLALKRGWGKVTILALLGAIGFSVGTVIAVFSMLDAPDNSLTDFITGAVAGAIGGLALGLALWDWRKFIGLTLAGALGFVIGALFLVIFGIYYEHVAWFAGPGIVGFTFLGAALGFLEKGKAETV